jgi:hypothetical protein
MPCYRCGERQTDPDRGASPWKRGVRDNSQVLVCPACQTGRDWAADLDHCPACSRVHLVRRLGEVECKDCGHVAQPAAAAPSPAAPSPAAPSPAAPVPVTAPASGLAEEVAQALDRVLAAHRLPP